MLGNVRGRNGCDRPPAVTQHEGRYWGRKCDSSSQHCARDGGNEGRARLARVFVFRGGAAAVRLRLTDGVCRFGALRVALVHRACALGAARHASFGSRRPARADRCVTGRNQNGQRKREQPPAESQHTSRMQDGAGSVNSTPIFGSSIGVLRLRLTDGVCGSVRANDRQQKGTILRRFNVVRDRPIQGEDASRG